MTRGQRNPVWRKRKLKRVGKPPLSFFRLGEGKTFGKECFAGDQERFI